MHSPLPMSPNLLRTVTAPFATSWTAQVAALASMDRRAQSAVESRVTAIVSERERVRRELQAADVGVVASQTNFHYLPCQVEAEHTLERLGERDVHIRLAGPAELRITAGTRLDNDLRLRLFGHGVAVLDHGLPVVSWSCLGVRQRSVPRAPSTVPITHPWKRQSPRDSGWALLQRPPWGNGPQEW